MGTETAGTEINFCLFFCSHDFIFPFLSLFSDSPSVPYNEYSKWRVLGTWGEMQDVLGISMKCKELASVLALFQLHLLLSAVRWGKQRGGEQRLCAGTDWVELASFLLHPKFSALEWTFHTRSLLRRAYEDASCQRVGEEPEGNTGSKPSKRLLEMCTEMKTPENQPNGIKRRLPNLFWETRRCCPSQRDPQGLL